MYVIPNTGRNLQAFKELKGKMQTFHHFSKALQEGTFSDACVVIQMVSKKCVIICGANDVYGTINPNTKLQI